MGSSAVGPTEESVQATDATNVSGVSSKAAAHLSYAFQHAPSFFAILKGPDLVFEAVNSAYYRLVGRRPVLGRAIGEALPELRGQPFEDGLRSAIISGVAFHGREVKVQLQRTSDGEIEERVVDFTYLPLPGDHESAAGVIVHGQDVTETVRARAALEKARDRVELLHAFTTRLSLAQSLVEVADAVLAGSGHAFPESVGTVIARRASVEELEITAVSDCPGRVFENWRRFPISSNAPLAEAVRIRAPIVLESPQAWEDRYPDLLPLLIESGHRAQIVAPLIVAADCIGSIGIAFSTERCFTAEEVQFVVALAQHCAVAMERARLFELEKQARTEAEAASRFKSDFLASISHELRTPLNAIGGYAELIEMGIHGPVTDEQHTALGRIQASRRHLQRLLDSVLELSRIEAGATRYTIEQVPLAGALSECESLTSPQIRSRMLEYTREPFDDSIMVSGDRVKLQQILLNLLTNAVKYTPEKGRITLSVERIDDSIAISVIDTGPGIPAEKLDLIFEPFVQINTKLAANAGVGLGLAISRNLAKGMGGNLSAVSRSGGGSTFTLTLPAAPV